MANYDLGTLSSTPTSRNRYSVTPSDSTDVFEFDIYGNQNINLNLHNISPGGDADLRLYQDSNGNGRLDSGDRLVRSSIRSGNADDFINVRASTGTYFAQVSRYSGSSSSVRYDLDLSSASPSNLLQKGVEVGNLSRDRTYQGSVGNSDTSDIYAFSLGLYEGTNIRLSGLSSDADVRVIRDANNNQIVDPGEVVGSSTRGGTLSELISGLDRSGNYFLQVYQYSGNTNYRVTFDHYTTSYA